MSRNLIETLIGNALRHHYKACKRAHVDNDGWHDCEAAAVMKRVPYIRASLELVDAAERWRIEMRSTVGGPSDQRLVEAVELYREAMGAS